MGGVRVRYGKGREENELVAGGTPVGSDCYPSRRLASSNDESSLSVAIFDGFFPRF